MSKDKDGKFAAMQPTGIRGYDWKRFCYNDLFKVNAQGCAIGNQRIATACASSGGTSEPHGRDFPILWRGDRRPSEDLNNLVAKGDGWYLTHAFDINDRGQILCLGYRTDEKTIEHRLGSPRTVVLTPLAR